MSRIKNWPCIHTEIQVVSGVSAPLAWYPVDLHTASNGRSCTIHDPGTLSVSLNTQCLLAAPAHWVELHGHRDQSCPYLGNNPDRRKCKLLHGSQCLCTSPARCAHREPRDLTTHCRAAVYVCRYTHACTNHLTHRLSSHPTPTSTPGRGHRALLMLGRQELMEERLGRKLKAKKVESPAHDSSPITSVNPGAQE